VVEVIVLKLPSGKVVVLLYVEVKELSVVGADVVFDEDEDEWLVVVVRVLCTVLVDVVLGTVDDEEDELWLVVVVVVTAVVVGTELELELVVDVVDGSVVDLEVVVCTVVVGISLLELEVVTGTEVVVESTDAVVELLSRLASLTRLAIVSSSPCRASAALMSVGKMPSWNLRDRACRAS
jgi:hypothetical protein